FTLAKNKKGANGMRKIVLAIVVVLIAISISFGLTYATTDEGDRVLLFSDGTWIYSAQTSRWREVLTVAGSSSKMSRTFTVNSDSWRIKASTDKDFLTIYLRDSNGDILSKVLSFNVPGSDVSYRYEKGTFMLDIIATGEYSIVVEEERSETTDSSTSSSPESGNNPYYNHDSLLYSIIFDGDLLNNMNAIFGKPPEIIFLEDSMGSVYKIEEGVYGIVYDSFWEHESESAFAFYRFSDNGLCYLGITIHVPEGFTKAEAMFGILDRFLYEYGEPEFGDYDGMFFAWKIAGDISLLFDYSEATEQDENDAIGIFYFKDDEQ
ncbi:hypothetical protein, partial [Mesotoga sp. TolDC]|uniref:hypothetical protein n=2 Tax=unclassified Mesotoga TaxID=1184398 RepID=UPI001C64D09E